MKRRGKSKRKMSNEHFYNYASKNLSISLPFFSSHHSVLILSLKTFCFFYLGKQNMTSSTRISEFSHECESESYQASCLVFPTFSTRKCISFPKVINECLVLLFATRNLSFLFLISQLSQFASKAEVIFVNFCLEMRRYLQNNLYSWLWALSCSWYGMTQMLTRRYESPKIWSVERKWTWNESTKLRRRKR